MDEHAPEIGETYWTGEHYERFEEGCFGGVEDESARVRLFGEGEPFVVVEETWVDTEDRPEGPLRLIHKAEFADPTLQDPSGQEDDDG